MEQYRRPNIAKELFVEVGRVFSTEPAIINPATLDASALGINDLFIVRVRSETSDYGTGPKLWRGIHLTSRRDALDGYSCLISQDLEAIHAEADVPGAAVWLDLSSKSHRILIESMHKQLSSTEFIPIDQHQWSVEEITMAKELRHE